MSEPQAALERVLIIARDLRDRAEAVEDAALKLRIADLLLALGDLRDALGDPVPSPAAPAASEPVYRDGAYWWDDAGPYCTDCWDNEGRRIRLRRLEGALAGMGRYTCPHCNGIFKN